jgi:hypothetical protein
MATPKLERVGSDSPHCCQGETGSGPCVYKAVPGSKFCSLHGGGCTALAQDRQELRNYQLSVAKFADRARSLGSSPGIKNLSDEIALMRVTLETVFNSISSENEMLLYADRIEKLTHGIQKLVESWQKIQERNNELLGREQVMAIFDALLIKIVEKVKDPDILKQLAEDAFEIITKGLGGTIS